LTNEKWHFWQQNPLQPIYHNKHSISNGEKIAKFGICGNITFLTKFAQILTNEK